MRFKGWGWFWMLRIVVVLNWPRSKLQQWPCPCLVVPSHDWPLGNRLSDHRTVLENTLPLSFFVTGTRSITIAALTIGQEAKWKHDSLNATSSSSNHTSSGLFLLVKIPLKTPMFWHDLRSNGSSVLYYSILRDFTSMRFSAPVQTGPGFHPASYTMYTRSFQGVKTPERSVNHPPNLAPRIKKSKNCTFTPPLCLHGRL